MTAATVETLRPLPVEADSKRVDEALRNAHDTIEEVVWALDDFDKLGGHELGIPPITHEHLASLVMIRSELARRLEELQAFLKRIDSGIEATIAIREEQTARYA
jgi:hypothetical protein